ncbi:MAG: TIGR02281 family clan AA aspartic protease [Roseiarcus sp.]|jgi:aspartyl protease family protein
MLRFAIVVAGGAVILALITTDLASSFITAGAQSSAPARPAPFKADVASVAPAPNGYTEAEIVADAGGQYATDVEVNGQMVRMMVDTGATMVVISYDTASRLGMAPAASDYTGRVRTANGVAAVAPVTLREVTVGPVYVGDVKALVADRSAGAVNLLGMSFLKRLASVEQRDGKLVLRQ